MKERTIKKNVYFLQSYLFVEKVDNIHNKKKNRKLKLFIREFHCIPYSLGKWKKKELRTKFMIKTTLKKSYHHKKEKFKF